MKRKDKPSIDAVVRTRGLFDHVKHIRQTQSSNYYNTLSEAERKTFNKYMILRALSMDVNVIEEISYISKYFEVLPDAQFYQLLIKCLPKDYKFYPYIKKSGKDINATVMGCICKKFGVGSKDASDYYRVWISTEVGINEMISLISSYGYSQSEIEKMFEE